MRRFVLLLATLVLLAAPPVRADQATAPYDYSYGTADHTTGLVLAIGGTTGRVGIARRSGPGHITAEAYATVLQLSAEEGGLLCIRLRSVVLPIEAFRACTNVEAGGREHLYVSALADLPDDAMVNVDVYLAGGPDVQIVGLARVESITFNPA